MMTWTWRMIWATAISCRHLIQRTVNCQTWKWKYVMNVQLGQEWQILTDSQSMVKAMSQSGGFRSLREATRLCCWPNPAGVHCEVTEAAWNEVLTGWLAVRWKVQSLLGEVKWKEYEGMCTECWIRSDFTRLWFRWFTIWFWAKELAEVMATVTGWAWNVSNLCETQLGEGWPFDILRLFDPFLFPYSFITFHRSETFRTRSMF